MKLSMEEFTALVARIEEINAVPLDQLELTEGGVPVTILAEKLEQAKFVGLTNFLMIHERFWEWEMEEVPA